VELEGTLETLTYRNEQTGYSVARLQVPGQSGQVTVVGTLHDPVVGQTLQLTGDWQNHPRWGRQFRIEASRSVTPATAEGIERYLGSGLVKGIGPELARRIVARFGTDSLRVLDEEPKRLAEVSGIGPSRLAALGEAWKAQRGLREVMLFLQSHDIGTANAWRIYRQYGAKSIERIRENPYRLAEEVYGIGFRTADRVAASLGLARDAPARLRAGCCSRWARPKEHLPAHGGAGPPGRRAAGAAGRAHWRKAFGSWLPPEGSSWKGFRTCRLCTPPKPGSPCSCTVWPPRALPSPPSRKRTSPAPKAAWG
jgi:ATP-dependent exoDNAse (exonuclease V) alpha subunit